MNTGSLLTAIIFLPTIGALLLLLFNKKSEEAMRVFALCFTVLTFVATLFLLNEFNADDGGLQPIVSNGEIVELYTVKEDGSIEANGKILTEFTRGTSTPWIENWNIHYRLGYDGISVPLVLLTSFISMMAMLASWSIKKLVKGYLILFLLLETGMLGVFLALDFFLFYVFWEVMLLPMYFLIGVWGGPRKEYAAIKFFLYTLAGSVLMLIAMLMYYFNSGSTFNLMELTELAKSGHFSQNMQMAAFIMLFIGFAIKVPSFPFHTWLPDAHVEAPTPISMILAGVLLKMVGYGIIRIGFPLFPYGAQYAAYVLVLIGVISIIYGAFAALAQTDFKRLVAYSSVSHMGYVLIGIAVWKINETTGTTIGKDYSIMGLNGAMFQMIGHGVSSAGMFFIVGVIYDRVHHRDLNKFGGLVGLMPLYSGLAAGLFFAGLGLPGMCGFIGEVFVVLSTWNYSPLLAIIAASGVILTAGYILWTIQRVFLGAEYKGPHADEIKPITGRETAVASILLAAAIILGCFPKQTMFWMMEKTTTSLVNSLEDGYQNSMKNPGTVKPITTKKDKAVSLLAPK